MAALFASGSVSEDGDGAVLGGLRFYFGQHDKTLIRRHREDEPPGLDTFTAGGNGGLITGNGGSGGDPGL
jgi:hypothetical protein